jgi:hypothetical protein
MPLLATQARVFAFMLHGQVNADPIANVNSLAALAHTGYDDPSIVKETPSSEFTPHKIRALMAGTVAGTALLAALEGDGHLTKLCVFLRRLQLGDVQRYLTNHSSTNIAQLEYFVHGPEVDPHDCMSTWTAPASIPTAVAAKLTLRDTSDMRKLIVWINTNLGDVAYLTGALPQDTFSKIGHDKNEYFRTFMVTILTASKLDKTFKLGQSRQSGHALFAQVKAHFLTNADNLSEIQRLYSEFASLQMNGGIQDLIEEVHRIVECLENLGEETSYINLYIKLKNILENAGNVHIATSCTAFRAMHSIPNEDTWTQFLAFFTNDVKAMAIRINVKQENGKEIMKVGTKDNVHIRKVKRLALNEKNLVVAMNKLTHNGKIPDSVGGPKIVGVSDVMVKFVERARAYWNEQTMGIHSELNKIYNANLLKDGSGAVNYGAFLEQLVREHQQGKASSTPAPRKNHDPVNASSLQADIFAADIFRLETLDSDSSA